MGRKLTTKEFITRAKDVHGGKYDYSLVEYVNNRTKVRIICPEHGVFEQIPSNHLLGHGCLQCINNQRRSTTGEFITRAREIHGDRYDYSLVKYVNAQTKVKIICPEHGVFEQTPSEHLRKQGCPYCGGTKKLTVKDFITRACEIHGGKYDYSLVDYINAMVKVRIVCPKHGIFEQTPNSHISIKAGCPKCAAEQKQLTTGEFIQRAREVHGDKYDYSLVEYFGNQTKIKIICPEHGVFEQTPSNHLLGHGCPQCAKTGFDLSKPGTLYVLANDKQCPTLLKIGVTNNLKQRLRQLQRETPHPVVKLVSYPFPHGADAYKLEQEIHKVYHELNARLKGFDGATEWFIFSPAILDYIQNNS